MTKNSSGGLPSIIWTNEGGDDDIGDQTIERFMDRLESIRSTVEPLGIVPIPYTLPLLGINFAGYVGYNVNNPEDSYTEGAGAGLVVYSYFLNRRRARACGTGTGIRACIELRLNKRQLVGRVYYLKIKCQAWPPECTKGWTEAASEILASW